MWQIYVLPKNLKYLKSSRKLRNDKSIIFCLLQGVLFQRRQDWSQILYC